MEYLDLVFERFAELLDHRLANTSIVTEDAVRYTMFHCLTNFAKVHPSDVIPEFPHPTITGAQIDTVVRAQDMRPELVFEFKFDRRIPSQRNLNKTQRAGGVFSDVFRLARYPGIATRRIFVYLTDREMAIYFQNQHNNLDDFFNLDSNNQLNITEEYISSHPKTFRERASHVVDCVVTAISGKNFGEFCLRIYEVMGPPERSESLGSNGSQRQP